MSARSHAAGRRQFLRITDGRPQRRRRRSSRPTTFRRAVRRSVSRPTTSRVPTRSPWPLTRDGRTRTERSVRWGCRRESLDTGPRGRDRRLDRW